MIDINNKIFNFYDPSNIMESELESLQNSLSEGIFTDSIYTISEKYIPEREKTYLLNQFNNLVTNFNFEKSKIINKEENNLSGIEVIFRKELINYNQEIQDYCLVDSNFMLIDVFDNIEIIMSDNILDEFKNQNIIPIIAHPERFNKNTEISKFEKLKNNGVLFQMSLGSLDGSFGEDAKLNSINLLENDIYDFIASDTVNYDNLNQSYLEKILDDLSEIIGHSKLDEIIYKNPLNIIDHKNSNNYQI